MSALRFDAVSLSSTIADNYHAFQAGRGARELSGYSRSCCRRVLRSECAKQGRMRAELPHALAELHAELHAGALAVHASTRGVDGMGAHSSDTLARGPHAYDVDAAPR